MSLDSSIPIPGQSLGVRYWNDDAAFDHLESSSNEAGVFIGGQPDVLMAVNKYMVDPVIGNALIVGKMLEFSGGGVVKIQTGIGCQPIIVVPVHGNFFHVVVGQTIGVIVLMG